MKDEQNGKHVRRESGIEHECPDYLSLYVVAHDEMCDKLESHEQNDPEQVKLRKDCKAEICAAISEYNEGATGGRVIYPKTLN